MEQESRVEFRIWMKANIEALSFTNDQAQRIKQSNIFFCAGSVPKKDLNTGYPHKQHISLYGICIAKENPSLKDISLKVF